MIFVTVGTHEQSFTRLVKKIDDLVGEKIIDEKVFIQTGYTDYIPKHCEYASMIDNALMEQYSKEAKIVITHGGPGSIMTPFGFGKIPIVVPRQHECGEHVDNHQVKFTNKLESAQKVIAVYDIEKLADTILNYDEKVKTLKNDFESNTKKFSEKFEKVCLSLFDK